MALVAHVLFTLLLFAIIREWKTAVFFKCLLQRSSRH